MNTLDRKKKNQTDQEEDRQTNTIKEKQARNDLYALTAATAADNNEYNPY